MAMIVVCKRAYLPWWRVHHQWRFYLPFACDISARCWHTSNMYFGCIRRAASAQICRQTVAVLTSFQAKKATLCSLLPVQTLFMQQSETQPFYHFSLSHSVRVTNVFQCLAASVCHTPRPIYMIHETVRIWAINVAHKVMGGWTHA